MEQYIDKSALVAWLKERIRDYWSDSENTMGIFPYALEEVIKYVDTLKVEEIETPVIPKHSYFEQIYHCGSEPRWKIGDVLAAYEFYSDHEGEYMYGKITDVKMDEDEDWLYTFENGDEYYEYMLINDEAYKKN